MSIRFRFTGEQQADLEQLLRDQQDRRSPELPQGLQNVVQSVGGLSTMRAAPRFTNTALWAKLQLHRARRLGDDLQR